MQYHCLVSQIDRPAQRHRTLLPCGTQRNLTYRITPIVKLGQIRRRQYQLRVVTVRTRQIKRSRYQILFQNQTRGHTQSAYIAQIVYVTSTDRYRVRRDVRRVRDRYCLITVGYLKTLTRRIDRSANTQIHRVR